MVKSATSKRPYRPSAAAIAMLQNLAAGREPTAGLSGRAAYGGAEATRAALWRHGLRDSDGITAEGHAAIARATGGRA